MKMDFGEMKIPTMIDISAAWYGDELRNKSELWSYQLSSEEISELENAASNFIKSDEPLGKISKKSFRLPKLGSILAKLQKMSSERIWLLNSYEACLLNNMTLQPTQRCLWNWILSWSRSVSKCRWPLARTC